MGSDAARWSKRHAARRLASGSQMARLRHANGGERRKWREAQMGRSRSQWLGCASQTGSIRDLADGSTCGLASGSAGASQAARSAISQTTPRSDMPDTLPGAGRRPRATGLHPPPPGSRAASRLPAKPGRLRAQRATLPAKPGRLRAQRATLPAKPGRLRAQRATLRPNGRHCEAKPSHLSAPRTICGPAAICEAEPSHLRAVAPVNPSVASPCRTG